MNSCRSDDVLFVFHYSLICLNSFYESKYGEGFKCMLAWLRNVNIAILVSHVSWNVLTSSTLLVQPCPCTITLNGHADISNLHCQLPCCCALLQVEISLKKSKTFIMPPKSRRSSRARTPSTRLNSPGSFAAKQAPAPSEHSAILTALNNIAERQDRLEARLAALPQFDQAHAHGHLNVDQPTMATSTDGPIQVQEPYARQGPPWPRHLCSQEVWQTTTLAGLFLCHIAYVTGLLEVGSYNLMICCLSQCRTPLMNL